MKITIDIEAKEIAELWTLALPDARLLDSKIIDAKEQIFDGIVSAIKSANLYRTSSWKERETEKPCQVRC